MNFFGLRPLVEGRRSNETQRALNNVVPFPAREAVFIGMCTNLPCQKKKTKVTLARLGLATVRLPVVRATIAPPPLHLSTTLCHFVHKF